VKFSEKIALIKAMFDRLDNAFEPIKPSSGKLNPLRQIYTRELKNERGHRKMVGGRYAISAVIAAKQQTVKWVLEYHLEPKPQIPAREVLWTRYSVLLAAGVAETYRNTIARVITEAEAREFLDNIDYARLVKGE